MNISDEAVEAAARALYGGSDIWGQEAYQEAMRVDARRAIEAAAPHLIPEEVLTSVAGLDALPAGSVVMGFSEWDQLVSRKSVDGAWEQAGTDDGWQASGIIEEYGSVRVLYRSAEASQ